jgi:osmoprotectant transport system permease protein
VKEQLALLPTYLFAHVELALAALLVGAALSIPLGILISRQRWLEGPVLGVAGIIQTIPGLALLAVMVPLLAALHLRSIGYLPAFLGLVLYGMLPMLRNTVAGLAGVDPAVREAAKGVGMTPGQELVRVELPLALPVIVAGIRTSTVWTVGMATLSTPVGAPSLGNYIFSGLQTRNASAVLVGCVAAAVLAVFLDGIVRLIAIGIERRKKPPLLVGSALLALLVLGSTASLARGLFVSSEKPIVIGAKTFTEQYVLSEVMALKIRSATRSPVEVAQSLGSTVVFDALRSGDVDAYVDYSGTIWATVMKREAPGATREQVLDEVRRYLDEHDGITLVGTLGFENAYALAMRRTEAERLGIRKISDLPIHAKKLTIGADYEFLGRPEWRALRDTYGLAFSGERSMDSSLMYQAAQQGTVDVISAFSTDGRIAAFDLVVLDDDRHAIPPYDAIVLAGKRLRTEHPAALAALASLTGKITAERMRAMNRAVDEEKKNPSAVASEFVATLPR